MEHSPRPSTPSNPYNPLPLAHIAFPCLSSPIKRLHNFVPQHRLNEPFIRRRMAPRFEVHFLRHGFGEARRPLLARVCGDDVGDGGLGDEVWVETYVICFGD
jgi:hypothetical protein